MQYILRVETQCGIQEMKGPAFPFSIFKHNREKKAKQTKANKIYPKTPSHLIIYQEIWVKEDVVVSASPPLHIWSATRLSISIQAGQTSVMNMMDAQDPLSPNT